MPVDTFVSQPRPAWPADGRIRKSPVASPMVANSDGPLGPFPDRIGDTDEDRDASDRIRRRLPWTVPSGLHVVGSRSGATRNWMTLNWATQVPAATG
jgi:hypothetical protein